MGYLKQMLRPSQITQPVLSQVDEPVLLGEGVVEYLYRRGDTTIWPPCATDISRSARFTAPPL